MYKITEVTKHRVAVLTLHGRPYHATMRRLLHYNFQAGMPDVYQPSFLTMILDKAAIKAKVRQLIQIDRFDSIMAVGEVCALYAKEVIDEVGGHPMIFIGVRDPVGQGLVQSLDRPGFTVTGVVREDAHDITLVSHIAKLYPSVRNVLVPYLPAAGRLEEKAFMFKRYLSTFGKNVFLVPITEQRESVLGTVAQYCNGKAECVVFLEGCYSNAFQAEVAELCWEKFVVFVGSGMSAIDVGASCSFASDLSHLASSAYGKLRDFAESGMPLGTMAVSVLPDDREFIANTDALRRIDFPKEELGKLCSHKDTKVMRLWVKKER